MSVARGGHPDGLVAVDTGLHPDLATDSTRLGPLDGVFRVHLPPDGTGSAGQVLDAAGFDPAAIDQVVLTHLHFDHAGGLVEFPNARLVVQASEWAARNDEDMLATGPTTPTTSTTDTIGWRSPVTTVSLATAP